MAAGLCRPWLKGRLAHCGQPQAGNVRHLDRAAGFQIDLLRPVDGHVFVRAQESAVRAIEHIGEAVAIEMRERFDLLPVDVHVGEYVLVDAVIVPLIEGRHLIGPDHLAGVDLAGEDGHRPFVVPLAVVALLDEVLAPQR